MDSMRPDALGPLGAMQRMTPLPGALQPAGDVSPLPGPIPGRRSEHLSDRSRRAIAEYFAGRRSGPRSALLFAGPAVLASTAYMDPGNFAGNIEAGGHFRYKLLLGGFVPHNISVVFPAPSAEAGNVPGAEIAEVCRQHQPPP